MNNNEKHFFLAVNINHLLNTKAKRREDNDIRTKVLTEKIGQELEAIPELAKYLNEDDPNLKRTFFVEFGRYIKYNRYQRGETIQYIGEGDKRFYLIITGRILKLNIRYKNLYISLKDYITHLAKLLILGEKNLYNDCIKKNSEVLPIKENMDIVKFSDKIKFYDFQEEIKKIKKMKEEILFFSNEEKIKKKINVNEILELYNPKNDNKGKNQFLNNEMRFIISLPFFYVDKIMEPISFLGHLNKSRGIKNNSSYICLNHCDVFYIEKEDINKGDELIYNLIYRKKSETIIDKLFKNHYLFKEIDISFLSKNYSKYFEIINAKKDDYIIHQGNTYEGVYFILDGMMQLKSNRSYNELNDLNYSIMNNLDNKENLNNLNNKKKSGIINKLIHSPLFIKKSNQKKDINLETYTNNDIFGLNDIYDKKNGIYNFSVQCMTNEAKLFFLPKEIFTSLLTNQEINEKIISIIQEKKKILSLKIQKYKDLFELEFEKFLSQTKDEKNYSKIYLNIKPLENKPVINQLIIRNGKRRITNYKNSKYKSNSLTDMHKLYHREYNSNKNSQSNIRSNLILKNDYSPNKNITLIKNYKNDKCNIIPSISINKESQMNSINNINKKRDSKDRIKCNSISNIFDDNIFNNNNHNNHSFIKKKTRYKIIRSSSTECLSQLLSENRKIKKRMEEVFHFIERKNNEKDIIMPFLKEKKRKKINEINDLFKNEKINLNENVMNKKGNKILFDLSPKKNCITINKENYKKCILNLDSNNLFAKNNINNNNISKKIAFKKLV